MFETSEKNVSINFSIYDSKLAFKRSICLKACMAWRNHRFTYLMVECLLWDVWICYRKNAFSKCHQILRKFPYICFF